MGAATTAGGLEPALGRALNRAQAGNTTMLVPLTAQACAAAYFAQGVLVALQTRGLQLPAEDCRRLAAVSSVLLGSGLRIFLRAARMPMLPSDCAIAALLFGLLGDLLELKKKCSPAAIATPQQLIALLAGACDILHPCRQPPGARLAASGVGVGRCNHMSFAA